MNEQKIQELLLKIQDLEKQLKESKAQKKY
jgi:hypothetical protein